MMMDEEKPLGDSQETTNTSAEASNQASGGYADSSDANPIPTEVVGSNADVSSSDSVPVTDAASESADVLSMEEFLSTPDDVGESEGTASADAGAVPSSADVASLRQEIESLKVQLERRSSDYMRLAADFENFRKRTAKEREEQDERIKCTTVIELLPVVDNFERARSQIKPQTDGEMTIHKSYQGVYKQLVDGLKRLGVSPMRAEGQEFDPNLHEAVMREATHEFPEGTVIEELMRGYILGDRILRHAMVKVAVAPDDEPASVHEGAES